MDIKIDFGKGKTEYGAGVMIELSGEDVAHAISSYLFAHGYYVNGARTIRVNGELCEIGSVYIDPSGFVVKDGVKWDGRGSKM